MHLSSSPALRFVRSCLLTASVSSSLAAQQTDSAARADSALGVKRRPSPLETLIVTGALDPAPRRSAGVSATVVTNEDPATVGRGLSDALARVPGAYIDLAAGPGGPAIVRLRGGEEVFTQVLADGVNIVDNGGFFDMQGITGGTLDRVEVVRGPQSALYGSSAMSGVVQILATPGIPGSPRYHGTLEGGGSAMRGGNYRGSVGILGGSQRVLYSVAGEYGYDRGIFSIPHDLRSHAGVARIDAIASGNVKLTGVLRYIGVESNLPVRDPGVTRTPLDPDARNIRNRWISSLQATFAHGKTNHRLRASRFDRTFIYDDRRNDIAPDGAYPFFVFDATFRLHSVLDRTTLDYVGTTRLSRLGPIADATLSYGALFDRERLHDVTTGEFGDGDQRFAQNSGAVYAELNAQPTQRVSILAGARAEKFQRLDVAVVPRATMIVDAIPERLSLRAAAGAAYKAPNLQDVFADNPFIVSNPNLAPETSVSWEVGADGSVGDGLLSGSMTYFRQRYDDLIRTVPFENTDKTINRNLGRSRADGFEGSASVRPYPGWEIAGQGAWTRTEIIDNSGLSPDEYPVGGQLPFRPTFTASGFIRAPITSRFSLTLRGDAIGKQKVLTERFSGARTTLAGYEIGSLIARVKLMAGAEAYARVDNMFDRRIFTAYDRPGGRRALTVGLSWRESEGSSAREPVSLMRH